MTRDEIVRTIRQEIAEYRSPTVEQTQTLLEMIDELLAARQEEHSLVVEAMLASNTHQALMAAHEALVRTEKLRVLEHQRTAAALQNSEERFRAIFDAAAIGIALVDLTGRPLECNAALQTLLGYSADELYQMSLVDVAHPDDRAEAKRLTGELISGERDSYRMEKRYIRKDGDVVWGCLSMSLIRDTAGDPIFAIAMIEDITAQKRAEQRLAAQYRVSRLLAEGAPLDEMASRMLEAIGEQLGWQLGVLWLASAADVTLRCHTLWHAPGLDVSEFESASRQMSFPTGDGLPGRVRETGEPLWITDIANDPEFARQTVALRLRLQTAFAFPIRVEQEILGVIELYSHALQPSDLDLVRTAVTLGRQIGQFIERQRAEAALHESDARKTAILEAALDCIITIDHTGRILDWNPAAERTFGYRRDQVVGRDPVDLIIPPELRSRYRQALEHFLTSGEARSTGQRVEVTAVRADGSSFPVELSVAHSDSTVPPIFSGYLRDITERRRSADNQRFLLQAGKLLAASLDYEKTLQQVARLAVPMLADWCFVDLIEADHSIRRLAMAHVDPAREELLRDLHDRYPLDPHRPSPLMHVMQTRQPLLLPELSDDILRGAARDAGHLDELRALRLISGMIVPLEARGQMLGTMMFVIDQSPRRYDADDLALAQELANLAAISVDNARLYREVQQALEARDEFLALAAHELKAPLGPLFAATQALESWARREPPESPLEQRALEVLADAAQRLDKLIDMLREVSQVQFGNFTLEQQPIDLGALVERVVTDRAAAERHPIHLSRPPKPLVINGDALRLEHALQNLLDNAVKYSPHGGPILVRVERDGDEATIAVTDQGIGIPPTAQARLFERFYRAGNVDTYGISGFGIGLYLVREIAARHGGRVEVVSAEGHGSTFTIRLPLSPTP